MYPFLKPLLRLALFALLLSSATAYAQTPAVDPKVERIRQDLGYYQNDKQRTDALAAEIQRLREEIQHSLAEQNLRLQRIEERIKANAGKTAAQPAAAPLPAAAKQPKPAAILSVCSRGCDFNDLQLAVNAAEPGGEVDVAPEINGSCAVIAKPLHLVGKRGADGRRAHLAGGVCAGKAAFGDGGGEYRHRG